MTAKKSEAHRKFDDSVKYIKGQWGRGWARLGEDHQRALIRAECLAEIARAPRDADPVAYHDLVDEFATLAVQWQPGD